MRYLIFGFVFMLASVFYAQDNGNRFIVTQKVNQLLIEKADCAAKYKTSFNFYHIQLYNGQNMNRAKSIKADFSAQFPGVFAVVEWESPEFKVWVGEYETKLAADQALLKIKKKYPNAFIVNPKK